MIKRRMPVMQRDPSSKTLSTGLCVCMPTVEEVALALQYLADLKGPDLPHTLVGGVKHKGLHRGVGCPRSEDKLAGIAFHVLL